MLYNLILGIFLYVFFCRKILKGHKVIEESKIPNKCIAEVSGKLVFQEENDCVYPLIDFPEDKINDMSRKLINSHKEQLKSARIILQVSRHCNSKMISSLTLKCL